MKSDPAAMPSRHFIKFFSYGALLEVLLIAGTIGLPSNLGVHFRNFTVITHAPVMVIMGALGDSPIGIVFGLLFSFVLMASVWGILLFQLVRLRRWVWSRLAHRQKLAMLVATALVGLILLIQAVWEALPQTPMHFESSPEIKAVVEGNNAFAVDLYHQLQAQQGNLFFSPFSISSSLAMTSAGARGRTEAEMTNALHLNLPPEKLHPAFKALIERMDHIQRWNRIVLKCANSLWYQKDYHFQPAYERLLRENYFAEANAVDFRNPSGVAEEINRWIAKKTNHKILAGLSPGQLTPGTRMALCDAIYFKGKWQHQFKVSDTKPEEFHVTTNETVTVPMMSQKGHFKTARSKDGFVRLLEMPYVGTDLSMIILLPKAYYPSFDTDQPTLFDLEKNLTADNLRQWLAALNGAAENEIRIALPRFSTNRHFDLAQDLKALGLSSPFADSADFSGMDGTTNLFLSDVIHDTFVDVNESGTEAAAVTISLVLARGIPDEFIVNHPFLFLIRENASGSILFLGRIVDPTK